MNSQQRKQDRRHKALLEVGRNASATLYNAEQRLTKMQVERDQAIARVADMRMRLDRAEINAMEAATARVASAAIIEEYDRKLKDAESSIDDLIHVHDQKNQQIFALNEIIIGFKAQVKELTERDHDAAKLRRRLATKEQEIKDRDQRIRDLNSLLSYAKRDNIHTMVMGRRHDADAQVAVEASGFEQLHLPMEEAK